MFIPLDKDNIICLANVAAIIRADGGAVVLRTDGRRVSVPFSPINLAKRHLKLAADGERRRELILEKTSKGAIS
ncbi:MAG: hypothetical protein Q4E17_00895 [Synergistes sp.]|nr:hypothetical protein [Synergistes sp.]